MYTNQTGAFPVTSKKENKYIMILCGIDNDLVMSEAMKIFPGLTSFNAATQSSRK